MAASHAKNSFACINRIATIWQECEQSRTHGYDKLVWYSMLHRIVPRPVILSSVLCALVCSVVSSSFADEVSVSLAFAGNRESGGAPRPWELNVWSGQSDFDIVCEGEATGQRVTTFDGSNCSEEEASIHLKCDECSYKLNYRYIFQANDFHFLEWQWKALSLPKSGDVRSRRTDDQALQVYIYFSNGTALNYVWDSKAPAGTIVERKYGVPRFLRLIFFFLNLPPDVDVRNVVVRSGHNDLGEWVKESRNISEDYKSLFKKEVPPADGVGIQINSQHTNDYAEGMINRIILRTSTNQ